MTEEGFAQVRRFIKSPPNHVTLPLRRCAVLGDTPRPIH